jgi:hypothetical protein
MSILRLGDGVVDQADLWPPCPCRRGSEVDEDGAAVFRDLACIAASLRRADVLDCRQPRDARDDVADRRREGGLADAGGTALDQDALAGGLLEPGVEDPVHAARLAGPCSVRIDRLRPEEAADPEGTKTKASHPNVASSYVPAAHAGAIAFVVRVMRPS